jgi:hypothetical protein
MNLIKETTTYEEALNCERKEVQIKWKDSVDEEFKDMAKRCVWELIN